MSLSCKVVKVDESLGVVFGWAVISTINGKPYVDLQNDHVPEDVMMKAAVEYMEKRRAFKAMHTGDSIGSVVAAMPLTAEVAKAFGIKTNVTGLMIGVKPGDADTLAKFKDGEFTGFSIGGVTMEDEE